ncbi:hypothetical protein AZE42_06456, partial [Rhizopogon vesiculosus]
MTVLYLSVRDVTSAFDKDLVMTSKYYRFVTLPYHCTLCTHTRLLNWCYTNKLLNQHHRVVYVSQHHLPAFHLTRG